MAGNQISSPKIFIFYSLTCFILGFFSIVSANLIFNNTNNLLSIFNFISFITGFSLSVNKIVWLQNHFAIILNNIGILLVIVSICNYLVYKTSSRFFVENVQKLAITLVFSIFTIVFFFNSFVCDDAYITFRTVDNFINGFGLTWNTVERVQVYTHPLWMFTLSVFYFFIHNLTFISDVEKFLFISTFLSYFITLSVVILLSYQLILQKSFFILSMFILIIIHSNAFIDYSSSGLENPLSYLLIYLFFKRFTRFINKETIISLADIFWVFLFASLLYTNRQDSILLIAFPLVQVTILSFNKFKYKSINYILIGLLPAIIWTLFSLIYYGFPFPNTFYAKLDFGYTGIAVKQGINFMYHICLSDPITMLIIFIAIILPFWIKARKYKILSFSLSIYLVYIITTGGDFMGGRFYSVPFLLSVLLIIDVLMNKKNFFEIKYLIFRSVSFTNAWLLVISVIIYNIISPVTPVKYFFLRSIKNLNENSQTVKSIPSIFDIKNQYNRTFINGDKSYYFWDSNLLFYSRKGYPIFPSHAQRDKSTCDSCRNDKNMVLIKGGGIYGFCFGPTKFLIDAQSLSDPLIARLPPPDLSDGFFVAHFTKGIPAGYPESCSANKNLIEDQKLREYYEKIRTITRGDIFSLKRFQYIFELNFTHQRKYMEIYKSITTGEANPKIDL